MQFVVGHPYMVLLASGLLERVGAPLLFSPVLVAAERWLPAVICASMLLSGSPWLPA